MKGTVLTVDLTGNQALISGDDGVRYAFGAGDWREQQPPVKAERVDFVAADGGRATEVYRAAEGPRPAAPDAAWPASLDERYRGFYCSTDDRVLIGLCGGLAHKFDLDVRYVRTGMLLLGLFVIWLPYLLGFFLPRVPTRNVPRPG